MLIRSRTLTGLLFITLAGTSAAGAAQLTTSAHQTEQDKARQEALAPQQQDFQSSQQRVAPQGIPFPEETHCKLINRVDIDSDNQALTRKLLAKTAQQAQGRCLGSEGIRLLAYTLQNELIAQGYITSLIDVPSQSLEQGMLRLTLHYGKVGAIGYADGSDTTRLWNSLPTSSGTILRLSDLEQGMANMQRLPGATAHMKLLPGQHEGESDIQIARSLAKKWQLGAWLDDAGSKASGRYQAGGALYLYDLTTLTISCTFPAGAILNSISITTATTTAACITPSPSATGHSAPTGHTASIASSLTATGRRWIIRVKIATTAPR